MFLIHLKVVGSSFGGELSLDHILVDSVVYWLRQSLKGVFGSGWFAVYLLIQEVFVGLDITLGVQIGLVLHKLSRF